MARADIINNPGGSDDIARRSSPAMYIVKMSATTIYHFYIDETGADLYWNKSTDGGFTWGPIAQFKSAVNIVAFAVWYDKWTPGDVGTKVHLAYMDSTNHDIFYRALDTSTDTLGTETTIFAGVSVVSGVNTCIALTKAIGGNLYCAFDMDGGTEVGFYRSTDAGATWASLTDVNEAASTDYYLLAPGFAADTQDIICIFWDRSADEISRKLYDDSLNSWAETSIATAMVDPNTATCQPNFAIAVDDANNKILLAAWSNTDTLNADLRFFSLDESTITEKTNVVLNSTDDQGMCAVALATDTSTIYVFYGGKSDGSETFGTSIHVYYKTSTDGGTTWGSETLLSNYARNYQSLFTCPLFTGDFLAVYHENLTVGSGAQDPEYISIPIPAASGGGSANLLTGKL